MRSRPSRPLPHRVATISPYPKQKYSRARIFFFTVVTISVLSLYGLAISWQKPALNSGSQLLLQRDVGDVAEGYTSLDIRLGKRDKEVSRPRLLGQNSGFTNHRLQIVPART